MNYIEQYDEESDYTFEIPELDTAGYATLEEFAESQSAEIYEATLSAIYNAIELDLDWVPVFAVKDSDSVVSLNRDLFRDKLDRCLSYYQSIEEYEICSTIKDLQEQL
jgi:hypothetical protein